MTTQEFLKARAAMLAREADRIYYHHDRAMTAMTAMTKEEHTAMTKEEYTAMTAKFTYKYDIRRSVWIIYLNGVEIDSRMTPEEAAAYCDHENAEQARQSLEDRNGQ
jgi:ATP-dependent DNA ligase